MRQFMIALFNASVVTGVCILIFLLVFSLCGKRYGAKCRKIVWGLIAVCCLAPVRMPAVLPYSVDIPDVVIRRSDTAPIEHAVAQSGQTLSAGDQGAGNAAVSGVAGQEITATDVFFTLWICVGAALLLYYAVGYWRLKGTIKRLGQECTDSHIREILQEEAKRRQMKKVPRLWILRDSSMGPFTIGVLQSAIVLPDDVLDERDLRFILKHELLHCKNRDILWKMLFLLVNIIHWFNPLVWLLRKAAEQDIEICCDEAVVSGQDRTYREAYCDVIMSWAEKGSCKLNAASTGYVQGVKFIKRRFDSILNGRKKKGIFLIAAACAVLLLAGSLIQIQNGKKVYTVSQDSIHTDQGSESVTGQESGNVIGKGIESATGQESGNVTGQNSENVTGQNSENVTGETLDRTLKISSKDADRDLQTPSVQSSEEVQNLRRKMEDFCQAYFGGDADTIKEFLTASYSSDIEVYRDPGEVENMDMRDIAGLDGLNELSDTETYTLSRPFIVPGEDSLTYLSVIFEMENGEWKVSFYGLEK